MTTRRRFTAILASVFLGAALAPLAQAQAPTKLTIAYVPGTGDLSIFVADAKGYFKAEGLEVKTLPINTGPGVASAVASNSAQIGYGGMLPTIVAREQGIPFKFVLGGYYEQDHVFSDTVIIASYKSGVNSVADLKGKTIAVNNAGGVNDLQVRLKLKEAGIPMDSVKMLQIPFPQMQAALEMGDVDAVGTVDPFRTSILQHKLGKIIARGYVQRKYLAKAIPVAGFYATDEWIKANGDTLARLKRAIGKANVYIAANPSKAKNLLMQHLKLSATLAAAITLPPYSMQIDPVSVQAIMDAALIVGILKRPMTPQEVLMTDVK